MSHAKKTYSKAEMTLLENAIRDHIKEIGSIDKCKSMIGDYGLYKKALLTDSPTFVYDHRIASYGIECLRLQIIKLKKA